MKNETESTVWMTASRYAKHRSVSRQYVARMVKAGLLPMRGTLIDATKADALLDDRPDVGEAATGDNASRYAEAKLIREVFRARLARLDFETRQRRLVDADAVRARIQEHLAAIRESLDQFVDAISPAIAAETDRRKVHALMRSEITRELHRLSAILGGRADTGQSPKD